MIKCSKCQEEKTESEFQRRSETKSGYRKTCKECLSEMAQIKGYKTSEWRRNTKLRLIKSHGGECIDCGYTGPPYQFHFDHRDPSQKEFGLGTYKCGWDKLYEESLKCDLVCALCHNERTHKQRCNGCEFCI